MLRDVWRSFTGAARTTYSHIHSGFPHQTRRQNTGLGDSLKVFNIFYFHVALATAYEIIKITSKITVEQKLGTLAQVSSATDSARHSPGYKETENHHFDKGVVGGEWRQYSKRLQRLHKLKQKLITEGFGVNYKFCT